MRAGKVQLLRLMVFPALLALAACAPGPAAEEARPAPPAPPAAADGLLGQAWQLFEIDGGAPVAGSAPSLQFADGRLSGSSGCNRFMGDYTLDRGKGTIRTGQMASTMMACPEPLMQQEDRYLRLLGRVSRYRVEGEVLTLSADDGQAIRARK